MVDTHVSSSQNKMHYELVFKPKCKRADKKRASLRGSMPSILRDTLKNGSKYSGK